MTRRAHKAAFTLPEVLAASAVLAFAVTALTQAIVAGHMQSHAALRSARATALARAMLAEIHAKPYDDPDGEAGETGRAQFDDIDDYQGYSETSDQRLKDAAGQAYPEAYQRFRRDVTVQPHTLDLTNLDKEQTGLQIKVTTIHDTGQAWTLTRFVPNPNE
jgi:MSHA pilin protein MshD